MAGKTASERARTPAKVAKKAATKRVAAKPTLLAGGNPQIAKADGDAPVQAYIAAIARRRRA
jgi:DNA-binding phage protein